MRKIIFTTILLVALYSCSSPQPEFFNYDNPYDIERLDLNLDVAKFYSKVVVDDIYVLIEDEKIDGENWGDPDILIGKCYDQSRWHRDGVVARYANINFPKMSMFVDTTSRFVAACAVAEELKPAEIEKLTKRLTKKFGTAVRTIGHFGDDYNVYTWDTGESLIRVSTRQKDPNAGVLRIIIGSDDNGVTQLKEDEKDKGLVTELYLSVIRKDGGDELVKELNSGDFIFARRGKEVE